MDFDEMNAKVIAEFRANDGKVGGWFEGQDIVLLHTTGRKTGAPRINPLVAIDKADRLIVIASAGGAPHAPDWFYNLTADPEVTFEIGSEKGTATATVVEQPERDALYAEMVARMPQFADYEKSTEGIRTIPVVALHRQG